MTPVGALFELLARVGAADSVFVTAHELSRWPPDAVAAMKSQKLINKTAPAVTAVCPGCEQECTMPIEAVPASSGVPAYFVVCDKRDDINRVMILPDHLAQWQATTGRVTKFVAQNLSLRWQGTMTSAGDALQIGIVTGRWKSQMLCLRSDSELILVAGYGSLPLADIVCEAQPFPVPVPTQRGEPSPVGAMSGRCFVTPACHPCPEIRAGLTSSSSVAFRASHSSSDGTGKLRS